MQLLSWGVAVSMLVEQAVIFTQAAGGTTSRYNNSTGLSALLFRFMSVFIMVNTLMTVWAVYLAWRNQPHGPAGYVWGLRLGLLLFVVGSVLPGFALELYRLRMKKALLSCSTAFSMTASTGPASS